jgi:hypothetical protein
VCSGERYGALAKGIDDLGRMILPYDAFRQVFIRNRKPRF